MTSGTKNTQQRMMEKAAYLVGLSIKANDFALNTTEKVFDTTLKLADKSLDITSQVIKKGIDIADTQQDFAFDVLNGLKKKIIK